MKIHSLNSTIDSAAARSRTQARAFLEQQARALGQIAEGVDDGFGIAIDRILACGTVVTTGVGKSGLVARQLSALLSSTGTPSLFLHPTEAVHGDIGVLRAGDVVLAISNSGETDELVRLMPLIEARGAHLVSLVGEPQSTLARAACAVLNAGVSQELCSHNIVPTTSTLAAMAVGNALAMSLARAREWNPEDIASVHPGGSIGRKVAPTVSESMRRANLPLVSPRATVQEVTQAMSEAGLGVAMVVGAHKELLGVITDGDIRRGTQRHGQDLQSVRAADLMTDSAVTVAPNESMELARSRMRRLRLSALVVVSDNRRVVGVVDVYGGP